MLPQREIRWFVLGPLIINLLLFVGLTMAIVDQFTIILDWMMGYLPTWLDFIAWIIWVVFAGLLLIIYGYSFAIVGNLLAAPFYGLLAERVSELVSGQQTGEPFTIKRVAHIAGRSTVRELKKLGYFLPRIVGILLLTLALSFIPPLNLLSPIIIFMWGAWSLALQYLDYPADNHETDFDSLKKLIGKRRFASFSFGGSALLATTIPIFNIIAIPASVIGATVMWEKELKPDLESHQEG